MNRKFLLIISALTVAIVLIIVVVSFPKVALEVDNFQATLEQALIYQGVNSTFVTDANFTITNTGNKDSVSFTIFVETIGASRSTSIDPIDIQPLRMGETRVVTLEGYSGQGYPTLILHYQDDSHKFLFGDRLTVESWSVFG
jgi:hypothetical protein